MTAANTNPAIDGLFSETDQGPRLLGSRCASCSTPYFPRAERCNHPSCTNPAMEDAQFGPDGKLWSVAIQNYPPPPPVRYDEPFVPYAMGIVDLDDGLRVMGRIVTDDPATVKVNSAVKLVIEPLCQEEDGSTTLTWKFKEV